MRTGLLPGVAIALVVAAQTPAAGAQALATQPEVTAARPGTPASPPALDAAHFLTDEEAVTQVLDLAEQRMSLMPGVAAAKWQTHASILDPAREQVVIRHAGELAAPLGLSAQAVERIFAVQVRLAREWETRLTDEWSANGFQFAGPIPDLGKQVRPRLDAVTEQMLRALYVAAADLSRPGFAQRFAALASQRLRVAGWTVSGRQAFLNALAQVKGHKVAILGKVAAAQVLRIGLTGDYAPFALESDSRLSGVDVELARQLAASLHATPVFVRTTWHRLLQDLVDDDFDMAMGGISITPERQARGAFSVVYATGGKTLIGRCADKNRYQDLKSVDRPAVRVIVNPGGTNEHFARNTLQRAKIVEFPDNRGVFEEIRAGRADVMITDDTEVEWQTGHHQDLCRLYSGILTHADKAILMQRDAAFAAAVDEWLSARVAAGEPERLLKKIIADRADAP